MAHAYCAVLRCPSSSRKHRDIKFHKFPRNPIRRGPWIEACRRPELKHKTATQLCNMHVCGLHFEEYMYGKNQLKDTAIPTINLPPASTYSVLTQTEPWSEIKQEAIEDLENNSMKVKLEPVDDETEVSTEPVTEHDPCDPGPKKIKREMEVNELENGSSHLTIEQFLHGCDLYLSPELSQFVKTQIKIPD